MGSMVNSKMNGPATVRDNKRRVKLAKATLLSQPIRDSGVDCTAVHLHTPNSNNATKTVQFLTA